MPRSSPQPSGRGPLHSSLRGARRPPPPGRGGGSSTRAGRRSPPAASGRSGRRRSPDILLRNKSLALVAGTDWDAAEHVLLLGAQPGRGEAVLGDGVVVVVLVDEVHLRDE